MGWCLGATFRCTPAEAMGLWSTALFYATALAATAVHSCIIQARDPAGGRDEAATRRHTAQLYEPDGRTAATLLLWFFTFAGGCLLWAVAGVRACHPVQCGPVQLLGAGLLLACAGLYIATHVALGANWSPEPEQKVRHRLVTTGVYGWARHPLYAIFLWASRSSAPSLGRGISSTAPASPPSARRGAF